MNTKKTLPAARGAMRVTLDATEYVAIEVETGAAFRIRPTALADRIGPGPGPATHQSNIEPLGTVTAAVLGRVVELSTREVPAPEYALSPIARQLMVEAHERGGRVAIKRCTIRGVMTCGTETFSQEEGDAVLSSLAAQGLMTLGHTSGKMVPGGFELRSEWVLTPNGADVARTVAAS